MYADIPLPRWPTCSTRPSSRSTVPSNGPAPACNAACRRPASANRLRLLTHRPSSRSGPSPAGHPRAPAPGERNPPPALASPPEQALVAKSARAYESGDMEALVPLLTDDVFVSMPPIPLEYHGRQDVANFYANITRRGRSYDFVPTRANGQPAFGGYLRSPPGIR